MNRIHISSADSEADTCRKEVLPKLYDSGWTDDRILEQRYFTDGKIVVIGRKARRKKGKKPDYLLKYSSDYLIAVVEAKKKYKNAADGLQQAKDYAEILQLDFAYATNGSEIIEFDYITGVEQMVEKFPSPDELWNRHNNKEKIKDTIAQTLLKPFYPNPDKPPRYYQRIAINRATKAILEGQNRLLLTLATGTGKTTIAFQIIYKLWNNRWNRHGEHRRPKVLFIADRDVLISDPHSKDFAIFGNARCLIRDEGTVKSREIYFSTYQAIAEDSNRVGAYRDFDPDFFDLIVIDECHRGSASDEGNWKNILTYFDSAVQLGLTATPQRDDNKDTYLYFGNPLYIYSLRQGIDDGFLAPYIVHRVVTDADATGYRPYEGQRDAYGEEIPDGVYSTPDFERRLSLLPRTRAVAKHLHSYMKKTGRYDKTIIFCVDQEHADQMRRELNNLNNDIVKENPNYIVRIVSEEGDIGKGFLSIFMDIDEEYPVIVTTSRLLSTGVDIPTCKNIVIFRIVNSMTEFKQIVGRGTRVREDKEKLFFTILDYTGSATRKFADPEFDGLPPLITQEEIDEAGERREGTYVEYPHEDSTEEDDFEGNDDRNPTPDISTDEDITRRRKYYVDEGEVIISAESVQLLDDSGRLRTIEFNQYAKDKITTLYPSIDALKSSWDNLQERKTIIEELGNQGITIEQLREFTNQTDADIFDLLCFVAYDLKPKTRKERAELLRRNKPDFFNEYSEKARNVLNIILDKYVEYGLKQLDDLSILKVYPISDLGNVFEIANEFGGMDELKKAFERLQILLYAA